MHSEDSNERLAPVHFIDGSSVPHKETRTNNLHTTRASELPWLAAPPDKQTSQHRRAIVEHLTPHYKGHRRVGATQYMSCLSSSRQPHRWNAPPWRNACRHYFYFLPPVGVTPQLPPPPLLDPLLAPHSMLATSRPPPLLNPSSLRAVPQLFPRPVLPAERRCRTKDRQTTDQPGSSPPHDSRKEPTA